MFYNSFRSTRSSMKSQNKNNFHSLDKKRLNPRQRLLNLQKRQKLKDLLITKFMLKYGIKNAEEILQEEISKFLQGEKLTDQDLKRLDIKINSLLKEKQSKDKLKETLTQNFHEIQNETLPKIDKNININNININNKNNNTINTSSVSSMNRIPKIINTEPSLNTHNQTNFRNTLYTPMNTYYNKKKFIYKTPEEELAELEAEFEKDEIDSKNKNNFTRLDFTKEGDEWNAIAKYNRRLYEDQIKLDKIKDEEIKRRNKADLDLQIKQRLEKEYEDELKDKEYDKMMKEHQEALDEIDRKKQEAMKKQILKEKESRDEQMRQNYIKKRIEILKEKKFEKLLVKSIQEGIEKEKKEVIEKKKKENEALLKAIKENDLKLKMKKEKEKKEKEEEIKMGEERMKMQMKEDLDRKRYYDLIKNNGSKLSKKSLEVLEQIKKDQEQEEKRMQHYYEEKNKKEIEKEKQNELKKFNQKFELKKYLDMQIEERKKEEDFLKSLDKEQARIWALDCKKYNDDEIEIQNKIRDMNKRNMKRVMEQINKKNKNNKINRMNDTEYAINRKILEKAKTYLDN